MNKFHFLIAFVALISLTSGQENAVDGEDTDTLDCSNKPCDLTCPRMTTYRAGNDCTDACDQKICSTKLVCGCYCTDNYRKINGRCERKRACPRGTTTSDQLGIFGGRPGGLLGLGLGGLLGKGGILGGLLGGGNELLKSRRENVSEMLQQILGPVENNNNSSKNGGGK